jgi:hypothetical protein
MPGFLKAAAIVVSGGAIVGVGALALPNNSRHSASLLATGQISDLPSVPCEQQLWLNADRVCQTWTTPHSDVQRILSPEPVRAEPSRQPPPRPPAAPTGTRLTSDESTTKARPRTWHAAENRGARIARGEFVSRRIRVASRPVNATQTGFMFWPNSQQNTYRYRTRSSAQPNDMTRTFAFFGTSAH